MEGRQTRESIVDVWGPRTPYEGAWPARVDELTVETPQRWTQSVCVLCSTGCAVDVGVRDGRIVGVRGREVDRVNRGRLGPKGLHGWEANASRERLSHPLVRRQDRLERASWDEAMGLVARRTRETIERYTAGAVGFYNSGQLTLEECYTLATIGHAGIGTPHIDANTRLCTSTAAMALIESFGADGQPGSFTDLDTTEAIFHVGHNVAVTQTVLWARILDRRRGVNPPRLIVVDPRRTPAAEEADIHLAPRLGTNVPLLNGLINLVIQSGRVDYGFVEAHTVGFEALRSTVARWPVERTAAVTGIPAERLRAAAEVLGTTPTLVSTVLQGVYQSMQATAAAVQVNNLHLIRGLIGKPGATVFQMNGQPSAPNTRECGADGALVAFRNWANPAHVEELARHWNVDAVRIPRHGPSTHAMEIFRHAEEGTLRLLWIVCTNPAVSLPELRRVRAILGRRDLFVVVQDAFMTETAELADVLLPAAIWGEKTGCLTNADRTVHLALKAVEPPGEARADLDIFLDYARRMDFRDRDGAPLIKWHDPESAFEHWKGASRGRPCDYSGLTYDQLAGGSGIQWPCNDTHPHGAERLYTDGRFHTAPEDCQLYGHDLLTGAALTGDEYRARDPRGRAVLKPAEHVPPIEEPDDDYPFWLTTGRLVYHFHTRTKTGRAKALDQAAPEPFVQIADEDAARLGLREDDRVEVASRRGRLTLAVRVGGILAGHVFVPFHYGAWDDPTRQGAANELTLTGWDPVSKQPYVKFAAVRVRKV